MNERFLMECIPGSALKFEVEVDHYFDCRGVRYAVLYRLHHGKPLTYTLEPRFLIPIPSDYESDWPDE